jgi:hypothetical protein
LSAVSDPVAALDWLERRYDGPISETSRRIARCGSETRLRLIEAAGQAEFFRHLARGQIDIIRRRRRDGSFYAALADDLALYRREARRWAKRARELRARLEN